MEKVLMLLLAVGLCQAGQKYTRTVSYDDELVVRCTGVKEEKFYGLLGLDGVDVWKVTPDGSADIRMKKELYRELKGDYPECFILHSSVEQLVREAERLMKPQNTTAELAWFDEYHRYDEIVDWYKKLADDNTELVKFVDTIGKSYEGRDQPAVHITASVQPDVKKIYFQCQIHAREWISGATCMYLANELIERKDEELVSIILQQVEFIFVPFVNPDGYEYTWTNSRLWRKNRRPGTLCDGVDLNRNYNDHWAEGGGSSSNPCSETYHGTAAASEPETQNTQNYFRTSDDIVGAIDWHSYSQLILRPYGWTTADSPDEAQLKELGDQMSEDIFAVHEKRYTSQKSIGLYKTTGTASDWFYSDNANENNKYRAAGFTFELRDTGQYGFQLPPDQIIPTGEENFQAILRFAEELQAKPLEK